MPSHVHECGQGSNFELRWDGIDLAGTRWVEKGNVIWRPTLVASGSAYDPPFERETYDNEWRADERSAFYRRMLARTSTI
jgi:hypothetical protein